MTSSPASVESLKALSKKIPEIEEFFTATRALMSQDRSLVIMTSAYLERSLEAFIYHAKFIDLADPDFKKLFEGDSPLASFSAKIKIGYGLGLYNIAIRNDLDTIREIRNAFAHAATPIAFDTKEIITVCKRLTLDAFNEAARQPKVPPESGAMQKGRFTIITTTLIGLFWQAATEKTEDIYKFIMDFGVSRKVLKPPEK